jgi:hypothetical protein
MEAFKQYLVPYFISNILFLLAISAAFKKPMWARIFLAALFLWASYINSKTVIISPEIYLDYARLTPVPFYREFILGYFSRHIAQCILFVAAGEFLIFLGLLLNNRWVKLACIGGIIFGLAIAPLGIGSAFPATVSMAIAFFILNKKYVRGYIWGKGQFKSVYKQVS